MISIYNYILYIADDKHTNVIRLKTHSQQTYNKLNKMRDKSKMIYIYMQKMNLAKHITLLCKIDLNYSKNKKQTNDLWIKFIYNEIWHCLMF